MKLSFRNISIKYKIIIIIITATLMTQVVAAYFYARYDKNEFLQKNLQSLEIISQIVSNNSTAALLFNDSKQGTDILKSLKAEPYIKLACIFNDKKQPFANYKRDANNINCPQLFVNSNDTTILNEVSITILRPIFDESDSKVIIGYIFLDRDLKDYDIRFSQFLMVLFIITLASLFFAFIISTQMQKIISHPIRRLSATVKKITANSDFSVRLEKKGTTNLANLLVVLTECYQKLKNKTKPLF